MIRPRLVCVCISRLLLHNLVALENRKSERLLESVRLARRLCRAEVPVVADAIIRAICSARVASSVCRTFDAVRRSFLSTVSSLYCSLDTVIFRRSSLSVIQRDLSGSGSSRNLSRTAARPQSSAGQNQQARDLTPAVEKTHGEGAVCC